MTLTTLRMLTMGAVGVISLTLLLTSGLPTRADEPNAKSLEQAYEPEIRPLVQRYCQECHAGDRVEADLDLAAFAKWSDVRQHAQVWQKIGEMLDNGQMPPKDAPQPTDAERARLQKWVRGYLTLEAAAHAGDPGRVVLRRLSNVEYTYTLRDITGVATLDPAREFPVDGAAGEGFTNTGNALVMSPALVTKYLDAAKEVANHAILLPDGFRFSASTTRPDETEELLIQIRNLYRGFSATQGGDKVNLQGIIFDTNQGGRLPVEAYLAATVEERDALTKGSKSVAVVARERGLNAKYLGILWAKLTSKEPSLLLDGLREHWRMAKPEDTPKLAAEVAAWQKGLWKFATVGHIGKVGGPKSWQEPVSPVLAKQEVKFKVPAATDGQDITLSLVASDVGDGRDHDFAIWQQPRLVAPGRPDLLLRDVRQVASDLAALRTRMFANTAQYLDAAAEAAAADGKDSSVDLAKKYNVEPVALRAWLDYLGVGSSDIVDLQGHFKTKIDNAATYDFVKGWGTHDTPLLLANSSDQAVRVPGNMKPHSVAVHPSPTLRAAIGWRSPIKSIVKIEGVVTHAHPECGNGVTWSLELRRGTTRQRLATGIAHGAQPVKFGPLENVVIQTGDLVSLVIGPRDGNHACDLTAVDLQLTSTGDGTKTWNLAADVSSDILAGNPHADKFGNWVWHFYTEPEKGGPTDVGPIIPNDSLLAKWLATADVDAKGKVADDVQKLLTSPPPEAKDSPNAVLYRQLTSFSGPLFTAMRSAVPAAETNKTEANKPAPTSAAFGLDPALFGKHPNGSPVDAASLCVQAPSIITFTLPADLVAGCELVTTGLLDPVTGAEGSVQLEVVVGKPTRAAGLVTSEVKVTLAGGTWSDDNRRTAYSTPIVVTEISAARKRIEAAFDEYRQLFPAALCYTKIVPVDEVVTLTLFYREDDHLVRLMLDDAQKAQLDRLWDELHYISQDALTLVDAFIQLMEYATQDADPKVFEPLRKPINDRAAAFRKRLVDDEPKQLNALLAFAPKVYRRPLTAAETQELRSLYALLRKEEMPHEEAFRLVLARMLVAPSFLYRIEKPVPGDQQGPVSNYELANRLSYFLWASAPDAELMKAAAAGQLGDTQLLLAQSKRMLGDPKTRRLATEFACQWLHIHDFDHLDEKSDRHFPTFISLRGAMYEESIQFFTDLFQNNGSVLNILDADYTFLNEDLARHYGIPGVTGPEWRRVDGVKKFARGGILSQATTLSKQSGASRTSPILRGNWISEVLLGERLPRPPKGVPLLPEDEAAETLTVRQLTEKHVNDPKCSGCHQRIDPFGFSLESFDAIGRFREKDLGNRPLDTRVTAFDGSQFTGPEGLRNYLLNVRRDAFMRQFCKKLLGYALGRAVQLSDEPLLTEMQATLKKHDYQVVTAIETIIQSRQFREIRGRDRATEE
jgi:hypothetical protein